MKRFLPPVTALMLVAGIVLIAIGCSHPHESAPKYAQGVCTHRHYTPEWIQYIGKTFIVHPARWNVQIVLLDASTVFDVDSESAYKAADEAQALLVEYRDRFNENGDLVGRRFCRAFPIPCVTTKGDR